MWFLGSLFGLLVLVMVCDLIGALLVGCVPGRARPGARLFLGVPLGAAVLVLLATLIGWCGRGYAGWLPLLATTGLAAAGAVLERRRFGQMGRRFALLAATSTLAAFPILAPLWRRQSFAAYNDTYIYISQAEWLQTHPFRQWADTSGGFVAWSQVLMLQDSHLRMGGAFLLGWLEAIGNCFGLHWALEIFPLVAALGLLCGALAIGAVTLAACPRQRLLAWLAALGTAVSVNGFAFGAAHGFLPQTWGLALTTTALALLTAEIARARRGGPTIHGWRRGRAALPVAVAAAAGLHCYWDLLPFFGPSLVLGYLLPWTNLRHAWSRAWPAGLLCGLLVNAEWGRAVVGIWHNMHAIAANPVNWPVWAFPAVTVGLRSAIWEGSVWIWQVHRWALEDGTLAAAIGLALQSRLHRQQERPFPRPAPRWSALTPLAVWSALVALAFVYFRYGKASPWKEANDTGWPDGVGQSWSQFKVMCWVTPAVLGLLIPALAGTAGWWAGRFGRYASLGVLTVWIGTGLGWNWVLAEKRGLHVRQDTGYEADPFQAYLALRQALAGLSADDWFYLDWPADDAYLKHRELVTYFLHDRHLAGDWSRDGYIAFAMTAPAANRAPEDCEWRIRYHPLNEQAGAGVLLPGRFSVEPGARLANRFFLTRVDGPYPREGPLPTAFYWTDARLRLEFRRGLAETQPPSGETPPVPSVRGRLRLHCRAADAREVWVKVSAGATAPPWGIAATRQEQIFVSDPFDVTASGFTVDVSSAAAPVQPTVGETRALSFLIGQPEFVPGN